LPRTSFVLALVAATAFTGCGNLSLLRTTKSPAPSRGSPQQLLLGGVVAADAYTSYLYADAAQTLAGQKAVAQRFRDSVASEITALRQQRLPVSAQAPLAGFSSAGETLIAGLDALGQVSSLASMHALLTGSLSPAITRYEAAERPLRQALGIPPLRWLHTQRPQGLLYADTLAGSHPPIKWTLSGDVQYRGGGLRISTTGAALTSPTAPFQFDDRHITVQVDARVLRGDPTVGIVCPMLEGQSRAYLTGQIGPGAKYSFGLFRPEGTSSLLRGPFPTPRVLPRHSNRIRLDCDAYSSEFTTMRLYLGGKLVDYVSAPVQLATRGQPGVLVVSSGGAPAAVRFADWGVWRLNSVR
jgi:hypothetical protein